MNRNKRKRHYCILIAWSFGVALKLWWGRNPPPRVICHKGGHTLPEAKNWVSPKLGNKTFHVVTKNSHRKKWAKCFRAIQHSQRLSRHSSVSCVFMLLAGVSLPLWHKYLYMAFIFHSSRHVHTFLVAWSSLVYVGVLIPSFERLAISVMGAHLEALGLAGAVFILVTKCFTLKCHCVF